MNSSFCKRSLDFLDLCSTVLHDKTRDSRGDIMKTRSDVSHLRVQLVVFHDDRRTWERASTRRKTGLHSTTDSAPRLVVRRKTGMHPTTDSAPQQIVLMVANIFESSTNGSDCCCTSHNRLRNKFQMSRSGPKTTPTNHGPREKQSDKEQRSQHAKAPVHQKNSLPDKAAGRIIEVSNDF